ncbi:MAG: ferritin-like fold-containing protein [Actinomycetales bacterium]
MSDAAQDDDHLPSTLDDSISDLLGLLGYISLASFGRTAADCDLAPTLATKATLAGLAAGSYSQYERLVGLLRVRNADPEERMTPFVPAVDAFHARTRPHDWLEGALKAYIGAGMAIDFRSQARAAPGAQAALAGLERTSTLVPALAEQLQNSLSADITLTGRLSLWGRRVLGEALSQAQRVATDRADLAELVAGGSLATGQLLVRLTEGYSERVQALGLTP